MNTHRRFTYRCFQGRVRPLRKVFHLLAGGGLPDTALADFVYRPQVCATPYEHFPKATVRRWEAVLPRTGFKHRAAVYGVTGPHGDNLNLTFAGCISFAGGGRQIFLFSFDHLRRII